MTRPLRRPAKRRGPLISSPRCFGRFWSRFRRSVPLRALGKLCCVLCSGQRGALRLSPSAGAPPDRVRTRRRSPVLFRSPSLSLAQPSLSCVPLPLPKQTETRPQVLHSCTAERLEIVRSIDDHIEHQVYPILKDSEACWQPADFLPDSSSPDFVDEVRELRKRTDSLPDDYFVVLVGDMITEEALPTYMAMLNTLDGVRDETGAAPTPWARWTRAWTAEENRHGDLMNKYCYLSGRVNMKAVELTIQNLITSGMDPKTENNPYYGFIYT